MVRGVMARCDRVRIDVEGDGIDVDEDRCGAALRIALAQAMKVWLTVMTSSPGPTPATSSARCSAVVQFETAQAWRGAGQRGELGLEGRDLRPLRQPAGEHDGGGGVGLLAGRSRVGDRDHSGHL